MKMKLPNCPLFARLFAAVVVCSLFLSGCGLMGVNQIAPAPPGANMKNGVAPDGSRPGN